MKTKIEFSNGTVNEYDTSNVLDVVMALRQKSVDIKAKCEPELFKNAAEMLSALYSISGITVGKLNSTAKEISDILAGMVGL